MALLSVAAPIFIFLILMSLTYLNDDDRRAGAFRDHEHLYRAVTLNGGEYRQSALYFQNYIYAAHVMIFGYVVLSLPFELLFFIGALWLPFFVAHTALFRSYFLRWSDSRQQVETREKHKRQVSQDTIKRLSADTQSLQQQKEQIMTAYYHEFHNQVFR